MKVIVMKVIMKRTMTITMTKTIILKRKELSVIVAEEMGIGQVNVMRLNILKVILFRKIDFILMNAINY